MFKYLIACALLALPGMASDIVVSPGDSIQLAIDGALDGDRIVVQPGTYLETIDYLGKAIHVLGVGGAGQTTIDGGGASPVVRFGSGEGASSRLQGITVMGGMASFGAGGIVCTAGSTPTIEDCIIRNNRGKFGGGVSGSPTLRRCSIIDNTASLTHGGGIYGAPQMTHCVVASNTATSADGGGIYLVGGSAQVIDCVVVENGAVFANSSGGGIYVDSSATATIEGTVVAANFATGGAFAGVGGGVYVESAGTVLVGCTIVENSVSGSSTLGAGVYGPAELKNTIVRGNLGGANLSGVGAVSYSDVEGGFAGSGNVDIDPAFVSVAERDYHLGHGSLVIDLGDPLILDEDGTRSDIGAYVFQTLYTRPNMAADDWVDPSWQEVSALVGGKQVLQILAGSVFPADAFLTAGSSSGVDPGFMFQGMHVPLNPDGYFNFTISKPNIAPLSNSLGSLDGSGKAQTTFTLEPDLGSGLSGTTLHHATAVVEVGLAVPLVTNALRLDIVD